MNKIIRKALGNIIISDDIVACLLGARHLTLSYLVFEQSCILLRWNGGIA